jgi:hypothetical protein
MALRTISNLERRSTRWRDGRGLHRRILGAPGRRVKAFLGDAFGIHLPTPHDSAFSWRTALASGYVVAWYDNIVGNLIIYITSILSTNTTPVCQPLCGSY